MTLSFRRDGVWLWLTFRAETWLSLWSPNDRVDVCRLRPVWMELASPHSHPAQAVSRPTVVGRKHDQAGDKQRSTRQDRKHESGDSKYHEDPATGTTP
jgi:hypothetical protein